MFFFLGAVVVFCARVYVNECIPMLSKKHSARDCEIFYLRWGCSYRVAVVFYRRNSNGTR